MEFLNFTHAFTKLQIQGEFSEYSWLFIQKKKKKKKKKVKLLKSQYLTSPA